MAVYKQPRAKTFSYDFWVNSVRFRGSTGAKTEREAIKAEGRIKADIESGGAVKRKPEMKLRDAVGRYWVEKAQFEKNSATVFSQMSQLVDGLGADTMLSRITMDDLTRYQARRRAKSSVANRTINAEVPELISRVLKRAEKLWGRSVGTDKLDWSGLKLPLPQHRIRSASRREEVMLIRRVDISYRPLIRFAFLTGLRRTALLMRKSQIDWDAMVLSYPRKSKRSGDQGFLPITPAMEKILRVEVARDADSEFVFTYPAARSNKAVRKGRRYPITVSTLRTAMREAVKAAGLIDWRPVHDIRHTAATKTLRSSKNLRAVQTMLGHSDIGQTSRYAHVMLEDVREAMESATHKVPIISDERKKILS